MHDRTPAAVKESEIFKQIIEKPMRVFKREAVAKSIKIRSNNHFTYFAMGQFSVDSSEGKNLICIEYPYVRLKFLAAGISVGGKKNTAWVSGPCSIDKSKSDYITSIPLPFDQRSRWPAQDQDAKYSPKGNNTEVKFESILGDWPELWHLEQVEFMSAPGDSSDAIVLSKSELLRALGRGIFIGKK